MEKKFNYVIAAFLFLIVACQSENIEEFEIGEDLNPSGSKVYAIDSLTIQTSTILVDSMVTSQQSHLLVGRFEDEKLGITEAVSFFQLGFQNQTAPDFSEDDVFDSLALILDYNYAAGDTTKTQEISVFELSEEIQFGDGESSLYNTSKTPYFPNQLGNRIFKALPGLEDPLEIRLNDELGLELFNMAIEGDDNIADEEAFIDFFHGLALVPGENDDAAILGFTINNNEGVSDDEEEVTVPNIKMRLYYREPGEILNNTYYDFELRDISKAYFNLQGDRSQTYLSDLKNGEQRLSSTISSNEAYLQAGTGLRIRFDLPYFENLIESLGPDAYIMDAILRIEPVKGSYSSYFDLPEQLIMYECDNKNNLTDPINATATTDLQISVPNIDREFNENTYYEFRLTDYLLQRLDKEYYDGSGLLLLMPSPEFESTVERLMIGGEENRENPISLTVYYINSPF